MAEWKRDGPRRIPSMIAPIHHDARLSPMSRLPLFREPYGFTNFGGPSTSMCSDRARRPLARGRTRSRIAVSPDVNSTSRSLGPPPPSGVTPNSRGSRYGSPPLRLRELHDDLLRRPSYDQPPSTAGIVVPVQPLVEEPLQVLSGRARTRGVKSSLEASCSESAIVFSNRLPEFSVPTWPRRRGGQSRPSGTRPGDSPPRVRRDVLVHQGWCDCVSAVSRARTSPGRRE